jgi:hypothetical protein
MSPKDQRKEGQIHGTGQLDETGLADDEEKYVVADRSRYVGIWPSGCEEGKVVCSTVSYCLLRTTKSI